MIVVCSKCGKKYKIDITKMKSEKAKLNCKNCDNVLLISKPSTSKDDLSPAMPQGFGTSSAADTAPPEKLSIEGLSIRSKITAIIVVLIVVSLSAAGFIAITKSRNALLEQAENQLGLMVKQKSREYGLIFQRLAGEVEAMASFSENVYQQDSQTPDNDLNENILMPWTGKGYGSPKLDAALSDEKRNLKQVVQALQSIVSKDPYAVLGYLGTETNMMAIDDRAAVEAISKREGYVNTKRPWYIKAKDSRKTIWTAPYVDANTQDLIVTCATPVYKPNKQLAGVVGFDVLLSTIQKDILSLDIGYNGYAMLVDQDGKVLVRPGMNRGDMRWDATYQTENLTKSSNPAFNAIVNRMLKGNTGIELYETGGEQKYIAYAPLPEIGASLAIVVTTKEVVTPSIAIRNYITGVFVVVLIASILIGFLIGNNITKPIKELTVQANLISSGKRDLEVLDETRKDEIGVLTQAFNRLVTSLKLAMSRF